MQVTCYRRDRRAALLCAAVLPVALSLAGCQTAGTRPDAVPETQSWNIGPTDAYRTEELSAPTPDTIAGATVVKTDTLLKMMQEPEPPVVFDVLSRPHKSLPGALWLKGAGEGTGVDDDVQAKFAAAVENATGGDKTHRVVFLCSNAKCWLSHNATLRALALGYEDVYWYRGGVAAWKAAELPMVDPAPGW